MDERLCKINIGLFVPSPVYITAVFILHFNPLDSKSNYSAKSNNTKLVHWPLMGGLLHLVQRGGAWADCGPA